MHEEWIARDKDVSPGGPAIRTCCAFPATGLPSSVTEESLHLDHKGPRNLTLKGLTAGAGADIIGANKTRRCPPTLFFSISVRANPRPARSQTWSSKEALPP